MDPHSVFAAVVIVDVIEMIDVECLNRRRVKQPAECAHGPSVSVSVC